MILNNAPQNEAVLSNVGEIGEFRIRNSAKAFNILSSGLYANKIKAIIRELSCNAVDSHVAAGKGDVPFEVNLPNALEPHFSIRDFGTGLSHDQVTNIYTTYFESTKTASNDFIGALGLGSKSPFSYTDNFTVTAIKDGRKGIYSAFINGEGVPSIALMMEEQTDEPAGVEIKFSVNDRYDYNKFRDEAQSVYRYFKLKPEVKGVSNFTFDLMTYETENLIPGVHVREPRGYRNNSVAVMGNIAYPIDVPNAEQTLGSLRGMLECGLEIHFGIGEVDFQASREGLSYIPQTIEAIKSKLLAVQAALAERIKKDAEAIPHLWDRAVFLYKKRDHALWSGAVSKYAIDSKLETVDPTGNRYHFLLKDFKITLDDLRSKYNIELRAFSRRKGSSTCSTLYNGTDRVRDALGSYSTVSYWEISVSDNTDFVINDTNVGAGERAKYHYRETEISTPARNVFVINKANPARDLETEQFFKDLCSPPEDRIMMASDLKQKPRKDGMGRNISLLCMETHRRGYYGDDRVVWADAGKLSDFDANVTHYYVPLSGYNMVSDNGVTDAKELRKWMKDSGIRKLAEVNFYGVRKVDLEAVKAQPNWVNVEELIGKSLVVPDQNLILNMVRGQIDLFDFLGGRYDESLKFQHELVQDGSPFKNFVQKFDGYKRVTFSEHSLRQLYSAYGKKINFDLSAAVTAIASEFASVCERYPLLESIGNAEAAAIAEYVNLIDNVKGI